MEAFQAGWGRETPSERNTGMLAFADHLHAHKPNSLRERERENPQQGIVGPL